MKAHTQGGYAALLSVLVAGAISLTAALTLLVNGADSSRAALIEQQSMQARELANACTEEALQRIHDNTAFTGTDSLTLGKGDCSFTVTSTGASTRQIISNSAVQDVERKAETHVTIGVSSISITSYQEIP